MHAVWLAAALVLAADDPAGAIHGVVTDPDGAPLAGVAVVLGERFAEAQSAHAKSTTDADGQFRLVRPAFGETPTERVHALVAYKAGWAVSGMIIGDTEPTDSLRITLNPPDPVTVQLLDPEGNPVPNAKLGLSYITLDGANYHVGALLGDAVSFETDADGRASMELIPDGAAFSVEATTVAFGNQSAYVRRVDSPPTLQLRPVGRLIGRVTAQDPAVVRDLEISVESERGPSPGEARYPAMGRARVRTDAEGRFEIPALAEGQATLSLAIDRMSRHRLAERPSVAVRTGETAEVTIPLAPGTVVRGEVLDRETSQPIAGAVVLAYTPGTQGPMVEGHMVTTADDGKFEAFLGPGRFIASLRKIPHGYLWPINESRGGIIDPGTEELKIEPIRVSRGGTVRGVVVDENGQPVADAWVTASWTQREDQFSTTGSLSTRTDAKGAFVLQPVANDAELSLRSDTRERASVENTTVLPGHAEPIHLVITPDGAAPVEARVVDGRGAPVAGAKVRIRGGTRSFAGNRRWQSGAEFDNYWELTTDADGRFATPHPLPKLSGHSLLIEAEGMLRHQSSFEPGSSDPAKVLADIVLKRIFRLSGRILGSDGQSVAGATVSTHGSAPHGRLASAQTADDGSFTIDSAHPDARLVFVRKDGYRSTGAAIPADPQALELRLVRRDEPAPAAPLTMTRPPAEQRAKLLEELLTPVYAEMLEQPSDYFTREILELLAPSDRQFALDHVAEVRTARSRAALLLTLGELEDSLQQAGEITDPYSRTYAHLYAADGVQEPATRQQLLSEALVHARKEPNPARRVVLFGNVAERLIDAGQREAAEAVLDEGLAPAAELPNADRAGFARGHFAETLALIDPDEALALVQELKEESARNRHYGNIAHELAAIDPERAERVLGLIPGQSREQYTVRVCYRMAAVDAERARRLAVGITDHRQAAYGYGVMACALREEQPELARELLRESLAKLEGQANRGLRGRQLFPVAAVLLRFAELVDPVFAEEALWQVLALHAGPQEEFSGWDDAELRQDADMAQFALLLALYGREPELCRQIMDPIFQRAENWESKHIRASAPVVAAMVLVDPQRALAWHDRFFPKIEADHLRYIHPIQPWRAMAAMLAADDEDVWRWLQKEIFHQWVIDTEDF